MTATWIPCTIDKRKGEGAYATRRSATLVTLPQILQTHRNLHLFDSERCLAMAGHGAGGGVGGGAIVGVPACSVQSNGTIAE